MPEVLFLTWCFKQINSAFTFLIIRKAIANWWQTKILKKLSQKWNNSENVYQWRIKFHQMTWKGLKLKAPKSLVFRGHFFIIYRVSVLDSRSSCFYCFILILCWFKTMFEEEKAKPLSGLNGKVQNKNTKIKIPPRSSAKHTQLLPHNDQIFTKLPVIL